MEDKDQVDEVLEAAKQGEPTALGQAARMANTQGHPAQEEATDAVREGMKHHPAGQEDQDPS